MVGNADSECLVLSKVDNSDQRSDCTFCPV